MAETPMVERVKLTERQRVALRWADGSLSRHWSGTRYGSPPRATVNAMIRRGLMAQVGRPSMDLFMTTAAGRAALAAPDEGSGT